MQNLIKVTVLGILLASCGKQHKDTFKGKVTVEHDAIFNKYVKVYEVNTGKNRQTNIAFGDTTKYGGNVVGVCIKSRNTRAILINKDSWKFMRNSQREQLIAHELGHCDLNLGHTDSDLGKNDKGLDMACPKSMMRSYTFSINEIKECYDVSNDYYYGELL